MGEELVTCVAEASSLCSDCGCESACSAGMVDSFIMREKRVAND